MKKSIFIGVLALITLAACQNETTELLNNDAIVSKTMSREAFDPLKKDGLIYVTLDGIVYYMGERLPVSNSEDARMAIDIVKSPSKSARRAGTVCSASSGGTTVSLVIVSGDGQPNSYWIVTNSPAGITASPWNNPSYFDCMYLQMEAFLD